MRLLPKSMRLFMVDRGRKTGYPDYTLTALPRPEREASAMLVQNETGVLSGSERFYGTITDDTLRLFYYLSSCGHYFCENGYRIDRSGVDQLLLMYVENGSLTVEYGGRRQAAQAGDVILLDCSRRHYYAAPAYAEFYWLFFSGLNSFDLAAHLLRDGSAVFRTPNNDCIGSDCRHILSRFANHQPLVPSEHSRMLHSMLCYLMPDAETPVSDQPLTPARQAAEYLQAHLCEPLTLQRIAGAIGYSPSQLVRLFRKEFGRSPHEYLIGLRIDHAKYLLKTTSLPVKVIAARVGYQTETGFAAVFADKVGLSPRQFRTLPLG